MVVESALPAAAHSVGTKTAYATKKYSGTLESFKKVDLTPVIGTEIRGVQLSQLTDEQVADLAVLVSQRGVVFFRDQDITIDQEIDLGKKLAAPHGTLHVHPLTEEGSEFGDLITNISSELTNGKDGKKFVREVVPASTGWHSDITFEPNPSSYALLKLVDLPETGGDTLWASGYAAFEKLSPSLRAYVETLTARHSSFEQFNAIAKFRGKALRTERGLGNNNDTLEAIHPVVRTNPVTGWKTLFVNRGFTKRILELHKHESDTLLEYLINIVPNNHDIQVRWKWEKNSVAIWDNRSTYHTATPDIGNHFRRGLRVVPLGEAPFFDPNSKTQSEDTGKEE
ncbi:TfdA family taurine dioxygenase [Cladochytrium replicatum]|nr:TfdA family taurine dioxygenase [Cladochytrium replicatum]